MNHQFTYTLSLAAATKRAHVVSISKYVRALTAAALLLACAPIVLGQDKPQTPTKPRLLTHTEGVDFSGYVQEMLVTLKRNTMASLPDSVKSGAIGLVALRVQEQPDGTFLNETPIVVRSSGTDYLDSAALAAIRASAPFPHFPNAFRGSNLELRITFFYNVPVKSLVSPEPKKSEPGENSPK